MRRNTATYLPVVLMLGLLCVASGCAFGNRKVALRYQPVVNENTKANTQVLVADFDDQRDRPGSEIGCIRNLYRMKTARVLVAPGQSASDWMRDALVEELSAAGLKVSARARATGPDDLIIKGTLTELYGDMAICRMGADVALLRGDQTVWDQRYKVNHRIGMVTASATEYENLFQATLQNLMRQAVPDVLEAIERDEIARAKLPAAKLE